MECWSSGVMENPMLHHAAPFRQLSIRSGLGNIDAYGAFQAGAGD